MKLAADSVISERKLRDYLLSRRIEDDKAGFFFLPGYTEENWRRLEADYDERSKQLKLS